MTTQDLDRRSRSPQLSPTASVVAIVALTAALAFSACAGARADGNGGGTAVPPTPSASPSAPGATPVPSNVPGAGTIKLVLANATGADVSVDIVDGTGRLVGAESGAPGDGMSVEPGTLEVENVDPTTLRLTWVDYPIDNFLTLHIDESEGVIRLLLVQPAPTGPTDSIGFDRELILAFSEPIEADQVDAFLQEGLDTPG